MTGAFETIRLEGPVDGVLTATLSRPESLNAINATMFAELRLLTERCADDPEVRVVVLTGAGRGFCSGADLAEIESLPHTATPRFMAFQERGAAAIASFRSLSKPVVAAVNGPAAGGGLALALASDVRVAAPDARFTVAFTRLGLSGADVGVSWLLPRVVGLGHASELMLTARLIDADEALRIGLVNRVVPADDLLQAAGEIAREIARNSPFGVRLTKQALQLNVDAPSIEAAIALENRNQVLASRTQDMAEAVAAFVGGRDPAFKDR